MKMFKTKIANLVPYFKTHASELQMGVLPDGCMMTCPVDIEAENVLAQPKDGAELGLMSSRINIATYCKALDVWVLNDFISPDDMPYIGNKTTITKMQYRYMQAMAEYAFYVEPNYDKAFNKENAKGNTAKFVCKMNDKTYAQSVASTVKHVYEEIPETIKEALKAVAEMPTEKALVESAKAGRALNSANKDDNVKVRLVDVLHCMFGNTGRCRAVEPAMHEFPEDISVEQSEDFANQEPHPFYGMDGVCVENNQR